MSEAAAVQSKVRYIANAENFSKIPGSPIAYWVSEKMFQAFCQKHISDVADTCMGMTTGDNGRFLRLWFEVLQLKIKFNAKDNSEAKESKAKWFPYHKGGEYRRWYGNNDYIVNWENDGGSLKAFTGSTIRNTQFYFREAITWSLITSSINSFRYRPIGFVFGDAGPAVFAKQSELYILLALLNTKITQSVSEIINPTINCSSGVVANFPALLDLDNRNDISDIVLCNINISKSDWDNYETSWDFKKHPLI